jgi:hypothetical protein
VLLRPKRSSSCDYHIACSFDLEPSFNYRPLSPILQSALRRAPVFLDTPLLPSSRNFATLVGSLGIGEETATILDDIRFLLQAIIYQTNTDQKPLDVDDKNKLVATAKWVCDRIITSRRNPLDQTLSQDFMYQSCRKAALIYCKAITERTPLSRCCTTRDLSQLWATVWRVTLTQWKKIPGIFIWILLSVNQASQDTHHGRLIKSLLKSASFYIALENWEVIDGSLAAFVKLQRWLRERSVVEDSAETLDSLVAD